MEADFQRFYGLNLGDLIYGADPVPLRRLAALITHLPAESAIAREFGAPTPGDWTTGDELAAATLEFLGDFRELWIRSKIPKGKQVPKIPRIEVPRPGQRTADAAKAARPVATGAELAAFIGRRGESARYAPGDTADRSPRRARP